MPKIDLGKVVGEDAKITIGTTTTLDAGNDATVENVGTKSDAVLNFGIPKGYTPIKGTDYWTENDIDEIHDYVDEQISAIDLTPYSEKTETGHSIELSINAQTYVMTATLKNVSGDVLNTQTIDLPLETMVVSGSYDSATKEVVLTLQSGGTIRFSVSDLVDGLVSESDLEVTLANYVSRETFDSIVGDLDDLSTEDKTTLVNAINEAFAKTSEAQVFNEETFDISVQPTGDYVLGSNVRHISYPGVTSITTGWNGSIVRQVNVDDKNAYAIVITPSGDVRVVGKVNNTSRNIEATMLLTGAQNIRGEKTFMTTPKLHQNLTITDDQHIVNKKYVDDITGELANLDTTDKTNLVSAINEVASSGGAETYFVEDAATFVLLGKKKGIYIFKNSQINLKFSDDFLSVYTLNTFPLVIYLYQDITNDLQDGELLGYYTILGIYSSNYQIKKDSTKGTGLSLTDINSFKVVMTDENQVINGKKEFSKLPESSIVPTNDKQFTNKKYVDDSIAAAITTTLGGSY